MTLIMSLVLGAAAKFWTRRGFTVVITGPGNPEEKQLFQRTWKPKNPTDTVAR